jgi:hypothetical protein
VLAARGTRFPAITFPTDNPNSDLERGAASDGKHHRPAPPLHLRHHTDAVNSTTPPSSSTVAARAQPPSTFVMATNSSSSVPAPPSTDGLYHISTPPMSALSLSLFLPSISLVDLVIGPNYSQMLNVVPHWSTLMIILTYIGIRGLDLGVDPV